MKRVGLLAGLLVLMLGTGALAQSPSPEASPLFAPDDVASTIPSSVAGFDLEVVDVDMDEVVADPDGRADLQDILLPLGKEPSDVRAAYGIGATAPYPSLDSAGGEGIAIMAIRVDGVPAADISGDIVRVWLGEEDDGRTPVEQERLVLADREVLLSGDEDSPTYLYPQGEVLYIITTNAEDHRAVAEAALAELP